MHPSSFFLFFSLCSMMFYSHAQIPPANTHTTSTSNNRCPAWMNHTFKQLHSTNMIQLCELYNQKPMLIVNTASFCGFTYQFEELEKLHQTYLSQGVNIIGFASNDFNQEAKDEAKTASICYENYGVTFTMMAPISVSGQNAHPLFKSLAKKSTAPSWNFNKYLVNGDGTEVMHFSSRVAPTADAITEKIQSFLASNQ